MQNLFFRLFLGLDLFFVDTVSVISNLLCHFVGLFLPIFRQIFRWILEKTIRRAKIESSQHDTSKLTHPADQGVLPPLNCWRSFLVGVASNPNGRCVGQRLSISEGEYGDYYWLNYMQVKEYAIELGAALVAKGFVPTRSFPEEKFFGAREMRPLGVFCKLCAEWIIVQQACNAYGLTIVPLYETLGENALICAANEPRLNTIIVSVDLLPRLQGLLDKMPSVKSLVVVRDGACFANYGVCSNNEWTQSQKKKEEKLLESFCSSCPTIQLVWWEELMGSLRGNEHDQARSLPEYSPETVQCVLYTSGTTGIPKGVITTHARLVSSIDIFCSYSGDYPISSTDTYLMFLPMAHILGSISIMTALRHGVAVAVLSGDVNSRLGIELNAVRPTIFMAVPRVLNRLYSHIEQRRRQQSPWVYGISEFAAQAKLERLRRTGSAAHPIWDRILFRKMRNALGGRVRYILTGSAPLDSEIEARIAAYMSCPVIQVYGMTETVGGCFGTDPHWAAQSPINGKQGAPPLGTMSPSVEFRLESVPELGFLTSDNPPRGELVIRTPAVSDGYFRQSELTAATFEPEGWLHTGDIAELLPDDERKIRIIDRKKNIFKLSQGEYIAPEKIEALYSQSQFVSQLFVHGHSTEDCLVGVVVPPEAAAHQWMDQTGNKMTLEELGRSDDFRDAVRKDMEEAASASGLKGFEKVKNIHVTFTPFTVQNDLLTPTMKLKRVEVKKKFQAEIEKMYGELHERMKN